jgi:uncharacterized protein with von Willebrand factor type A (vWA) domain
MLIDFFFTLRRHKVKTSITEFLDLMSVLDAGLAYADIDDFYLLSRTVLIKDESQFDKFDKAFGEYFKGVQSIDLFDKEIPEDWLNNALEKLLSKEEREKIEALGGLDKLMETLQRTRKTSSRRK